MKARVHQSTMYAIIVPCHIYRHGVALVVGGMADLERHLRKYDYTLEQETRRLIEDNETHAKAWTFYTDSKRRDVVIYSQEPLSMATLVHEICHAAQFTLNNVGVADNEAFAYLVEYLFTEFTTCEDAARLLQLPYAPLRMQQCNIGHRPPCVRPRESFARKKTVSLQAQPSPPFANIIPKSNPPKETKQ